MTFSFTLDERASTGFSNASAYDAHRPSYNPEAVSALLTHLNLSGVKGAQIVDLACGTGKFTDLLAKREEGYEVIGVEPHEGMRRELEKKECKGVKVVDGNAAAMKGVSDGWADGVVVAQAFHWFATEDSLKEIHRVIRPGGALGLIWNIEDYNAPKDWPMASKYAQLMKDIIATLDDGHPRFRDGKWKDVFENQLNTNPLSAIKDQLTGNFSSFSLPLGEEYVEWTVYLSDEALWDRFATLSQIANCTEEKRADIKRQVMEEVKKEGTERNEKGEVALHGKTHLVWTSRI